MHADAGRPLTLPNFFIIGAMRSGTSSLAGYLREHPDVLLDTKEPHFFDQKYERGLEWYAGLFSEANGRTALGEATQTYMYDEQALERMAKDVPSAKLITILRNPVDRAYSHYWLNRAGARETLDFAAALAAEPERLARADDVERFRYSYVDRGRYIHQLRRVTELFPRESLLVLLFEDLRDEPLNTYKKLCAFLGIDSGFVPANLGVVVNHFTTHRSVGIREWGRKLPRPFNRVVRRLNSRESTYPPMDHRVRRNLLKSFAQDSAELGRWLGRDLSEWAS